MFRHAVFVALALIGTTASTQGAPPRAAPTTCPQPLAGWDTPDTGKAAQETEIWIDVYDRRILWNGTAVNVAELRALVSQTARFSPRPYLKLDPSRAADCNFARIVQRSIADRYPCDSANCWQGSRADFTHAGWNPKKPVKPW